MSKREVRVFSNASIFDERIDLLEAAATGVADTIRVAGHTSEFTPIKHEVTEFFSALEERSYNSQRHQLNIIDYANEIHRRTNLGDNTPTYLLTDKDVYATNTNFVFGMTLNSAQMAVQSVARYVTATRDEGLQQMVTRHVARHEFGHMMGMLDLTDYARPDMRGGLYDGHCRDVCTMQQVMNVREAFDAAAILSERQMAGFCGACVVSLRRKNP